MFKQFIIFSIIFFSFVGLRAQIGIISGKIVDSSNKNSLQLATVTLYRAIDTSYILYRLSDSKGFFKLSTLLIDVPLRVLISVSGYQVYRKDFTLSKEKNTIDFGFIKLKPSYQSLKEVIVIAEIPPVIFRKDTIEFNASSFKTLPTALVEELLKKLPGVDIRDDGSIWVHGIKVNRILVDGKRFFGDNYKMATRNLPANIIDKVQVTDDLEQNEFNPVASNGVPNKLINLTFKKGVKKGWFGKLYSGIGSSTRNEFGGIINLFKDTLQLSIIGFDNNINKSSFTMLDMQEIGGFNRSGNGSLSASSGISGEQFKINGIPFGGGTTGINRSNGAGFNLNHAPSKKLSIFTQYFFSSNRNEVVSNSTTSIPFVEGINTSFITNNLQENISAHSITGGLNWKLDSLSNFQFRMGYVSQLILGKNQSVQQILNERNGPLSQNTRDLFTNDTNGKFNYSVGYTHQFARTKKYFSFRHSYNKISNALNQLNESVKLISFPQSNISLLEQLRSTNSPISNKSLNISFWEVRNQRISYSFTSNYENNVFGKSIQTIVKSQNSNLYDSIILPSSNDLYRHLNKWNNGFSFSFQKNKIRIRSTIDFLQQWIEDRYAGFTNTKSAKNFSNLLFNVSFTLNKINLNYFENVQPPSIQDLMPIPDNSNPLIILKGNQYLLPYKSRYFNTFIRFANNKTGSNLTFNTNSTLISNSILSKLSVDSSGIQTYSPENISQTYSHLLNISYDRKFKSINNLLFGFSIHMMVSYEFKPVIIEKNIINANSLTEFVNVGLNFNWNNTVEFLPRYTFVNFHQRYAEKNSILNNINFFRHDINGTIIYRVNKQIALSANYKYLHESIISTKIPSNSFVTYADITYSFLENKRAQLKFFMNDLFNTNRGIISSRNGYSNTLTSMSILSRYFLVSFYYDIKNSSKRKVGKNNILLF